MLQIGWPRFLIDECVSYEYVSGLADRGYPDAVHPNHVGRRGYRDDQIVAWALADDRIIITANAEDYRDLLAKESVQVRSWLF